jgi:acyl-CoA reductase-like NAD-dependent aldehyde dehydrogenase
MTAVSSSVLEAMYIDGAWTTGAGTGSREIRSPFSGELLAVVPEATEADVDAAVSSAVRGFGENPLTPFERYEILLTTARLIKERAEDFAQLIVAEAGKPIRDARGEVTRAVQTITLCAEEAKRLGGEVVPMDATPGSEHRVGLTLSIPIGPVCAISPFNSPLNQLNHKVPTAIAAGCTVVVKPAEITPLSAIKLIETLVEAGLPAGHLNLLLGAGETVGQQLLEDERLAAYSFTGSVAVGKHIRKTVGLRKTVLELGNNSANIVHADADLDLAATAIAKSAYAYAGQLCVSAQRLLVHEAVLDEFVDRFAAQVGELHLGDPAVDETDVGPMIDEQAAIRAEQLIRNTVDAGARLVAGGRRRGSFIEPAILVDVAPDMQIACDEAFAPVVAVLSYSSLEEAVRLANDTRYGLQAALFTESIDVAFYLARRIEVGGLIVNDGSHFRIDQMPFGGVKESGAGREGVKYAIAEFTEPRLVAFALKPPR